MIHFDVLEGRDASRTAWILHGILGSGRNWRSFARRLLRDDPTWRFVLPDLRNHGQTGPLPGPHTLDACADDLAALPAPDRVIGHSFGGKVALAWARAVGTARDVWVLDSIPVSVQPGSEHEVLAVLEAVRAAPVPAPDRGVVRDHLLQAGFSTMLVDWLLTSLRRDEDGWRWVYGVDGVAEMMQDYFQTDLSDWLATPAASRPQVHLVRAGRSDRWTDDVMQRLHPGPGFVIHVLPEAGHWVHVDDPDGLAALLTQT